MATTKKGKRTGKRRASKRQPSIAKRVARIERVVTTAAEVLTTYRARRPELVDKLRNELASEGFLDGVPRTPGLLGQPFFNEIRPYLHIEVYDRDGGHRDPRVRIECHKMPRTMWERVLSFDMPCVACGASIHPFRERQRAGVKRRSYSQNVYYACTCPLETNIGCSRGDAARDEYRRVRIEIGADAAPAPKGQLSFPSFQ